MANDPIIYAGSASFFVGDTPFGFYDSDPDFQCDAESMTNYCAQRLGYPIVDVELNQLQFFTAFEAAVTEYGNQVNTFSARDNILSLMGFDTGSNINQKYIEPTLRGIIKLAKQYGSEVGAGGNLTWFSGSIQLIKDKQVYDIVSDSVIETGSFTTDQFTIRKIFHESPPSIIKYFDPYLGTGLGSQQFLEQFGWGGFSPPLNFLLMPMYYDVLRIQAIEFNDEIRRSGYSFKLTNNRLKIFPLPDSSDIKLWFNYTLDAEGAPGGIGGNDTDGIGKISDHSNIPYGRLVYKYVNEIGRQWIRKYTLALTKEMLGYVRGKYQTIPVPGDDTGLNDADLISAAESEKTALIEELRDMLDQMSRQAQMERKQAEADVLATHLAKIPLKIYIG